MIKMKNDFILVKELDGEYKTEGGIIIPDEKYKRKAIVLAVPENSDLNTGDLVFKSVGNETTFNINGREVKSLHRDKIFVVLEDGTKT